MSYISDQDLIHAMVAKCFHPELLMVPKVAKRINSAIKESLWSARHLSLFDFCVLIKVDLMDDSIYLSIDVDNFHFFYPRLKKYKIKHTTFLNALAKFPLML